MTLSIDLADDQLAVLSAKAKAEGLSVEQCAGQLLTKVLSLSGDRPPLGARIREIWSEMPDSVRSTLPPDGASQHDHYIYGVPKKDES
jgi:hypothetical protein